MDVNLFDHIVSKQQWDLIGVKHHHGINLPLFSLRSTNSLGIGEFYDLIPLIDWCGDVQFDVIQLLPINDTGHEPSPYSALSAFALNPIYISLLQLPFLDELPDIKEKFASYINSDQAERVDYLKVRSFKEALFDIYYFQAKDKILQNPDYLAFLNSNHHWLDDYALFKAIKKSQGWTSWETWEEPLKNPTSEAVQNLCAQHQEEIEKECILQFILSTQLHAIKNYALSKNIFLMGDIPILINRDSADVWLNRSNFLLDYSAGAPPDVFTEAGQNWGFPLYNWSELETKGFTWWKNRLQYAANFYQLYRIDHAIGFFRIWAIREGTTAKEGFFLPLDQNEWLPQGQKLISMMLNACPMLPIAEDLGVVHHGVRECLSALGICGTKVIRWERRWQTDRSFIPIEEYPVISLTTVSTHDSETIAGWWKNYPKEAAEYAQFKKAEYSSELSYEQLKSILGDSHQTQSLFHINLFNEYLALFPHMVASNPDEERINLPGTISDKNWSYRFKLNLDEILSHDGLKEIMRKFATEGMN